MSILFTMTYAKITLIVLYIKKLEYGNVWLYDAD